ncbi:GNAT family N-acetyltransferase [Clostridium sp. YB-6]|uniref:GNAT family N-acetyltransferase n=1 Tax=Clostridium weizhouense TaxID=2859781 RepID=A0ABS7AMK6_9CLOT|nr:GNAT family N-acetyltransferase [Clostridium weizhouense]
MENLESLILTKKSRYSLEYITVAERFGEILGVIVLIPSNKLEILSMNTDFKLINKFQGLKNKCFFILDCIKLIICKECEEGELYLANVATSTKVRGLGVGKILMDYAEKIAKKNKYYGISLLAKDEEVSSFYKKLNYKTILDKVILGERFIKMAKAF